MVRTGATFADACAEYLRYVEVELDRQPSTVGDHRSIIRAPAGQLALATAASERDHTLAERALALLRP